MPARGIGVNRRRLHRLSSCPVPCPARRRIGSSAPPNMRRRCRVHATPRTLWRSRWRGGISESMRCTALSASHRLRRISMYRTSRVIAHAERSRRARALRRAALWPATNPHCHTWTSSSRNSAVVGLSSAAALYACRILRRRVFFLMRGGYAMGGPDRKMAELLGSMSVRSCLTRHGRHGSLLTA